MWIAKETSFCHDLPNGKSRNDAMICKESSLRGRIYDLPEAIHESKKWIATNLLFFKSADSRNDRLKCEATIRRIYERSEVTIEVIAVVLCVVLV